MTRQERIRVLLNDAIEALQTLEIIDESYKHRVPEGAETHFKIIAVSPMFQGKTAVIRQRLVYAALKPEFAAGLHSPNRNLHALSLALYTPDEWATQKGQAPETPPCQHKRVE